jgi:ABC-type branched-subunit amino acid transport system permease subunit
MARAYLTLWRVLNGPQELGRGRVFWCLFAFVMLGLIAYPSVGSVFALSNLANFCLYVPMGLGLALLWGYSGVLSFGQSAFFAIAGYVYGIVAGNLLDMPGGTLLAAGCAIAASVAIAAAFG